MEADLGLAVTGGGRHEHAGTFNRLAFVGDTYLELIGVFDRSLAAASTAFAVARASLAVLDEGREGLAAWAVATDDVEAEVERAARGRVADRRRRGGVTDAARRRDRALGDGVPGRSVRTGRRSSSSTSPSAPNGGRPPAERAPSSGTRPAAPSGSRASRSRRATRGAPPPAIARRPGSTSATTAARWSGRSASGSSPPGRRPSRSWTSRATLRSRRVSSSASGCAGGSPSPSSRPRRSVRHTRSGRTSYARAVVAPLPCGHDG